MEPIWAHQSLASGLALGHQQSVYSPSGAKVAVMNGQALDHAYLRLPGGSEAIFTSSGLNQYRQADWLGSARLGSSTTGAAVQASAYAPYGESYQTWGGGLSFTGQNQDTVWNGTAALYDFPARRYSPTQGRWISPDPAGLAAVDPNDPQTWNRYAYIGNMPLNGVDPTGLFRWTDIFSGIANLFSDTWGAVAEIWGDGTPSAQFHYITNVNEPIRGKGGDDTEGLPLIIPGSVWQTRSSGFSFAAVGSKIQTAACSHVPDVIQAGVGLEPVVNLISGMGARWGHEGTQRVSE